MKVRPIQKGYFVIVNDVWRQVAAKNVQKAVSGVLKTLKREGVLNPTTGSLDIRYCELGKQELDSWNRERAGIPPVPALELVQS
jgi:hypothetical protein